MLIGQPTQFLTVAATPSGSLQEIRRRRNLKIEGPPCGARGGGGANRDESARPTQMTVRANKQADTQF